jgi:hypothetical protein
MHDISAAGDAHTFVPIYILPGFILHTHANQNFFIFLIFGVASFST